MRPLYRGGAVYIVALIKSLCFSFNPLYIDNSSIPLIIASASSLSQLIVFCMFATCRCRLSTGRPWKRTVSPPEYLALQNPFPNELITLKRGPLLRLARPPVLRTPHLGPQRHQYLLDAVIPRPVLRRRHLRVYDLAAVLVDARDVDLRDELDPRGDLRVALRDGDPELVPPLVVLGLYAFARARVYFVVVRSGGRAWTRSRGVLVRRASPGSSTLYFLAYALVTHPVRPEDAAVPLAEEYVRGIHQAVGYVHVAWGRRQFRVSCWREKKRATARASDRRPHDHASLAHPWPFSALSSSSRSLKFRGMVTTSPDGKRCIVRYYVRRDRPISFPCKSSALLFVCAALPRYRFVLMSLWLS